VKVYLILDLVADKSETPILVYDALIQIDALRQRIASILFSQRSLKLSPILSEPDVIRRMLEVDVVPGKVAIEVSDTRVQIKVGFNMMPMFIPASGSKNVAVDQMYAFRGGRKGAFNRVVSTHFRW